MVSSNHLIGLPVALHLSRPTRPFQEHQVLSCLQGSIGMREGFPLTSFVLVRSISRHSLARCSKNGFIWWLAYF
jgi:hypothetical protein